jgi:class 3 adenylate cyclase
MATGRVERRLAAILAADVAGYSRLMGIDEEGTLAALKDQTTGDGMLVEFASVIDAVRCAVDVQRMMLERNAEVAPDRRIQFRVGINVGDIISDDNDIYGDGVNVAARLEALAAPGGICVSRTMHDQGVRQARFFVRGHGRTAG